MKTIKEKDVVNKEAWEVVKNDLITTIRENVAMGKTNVDEVFGIDGFFEEFQKFGPELTTKLLFAPNQSSEQLLLLEKANSFAEYVYIAVMAKKVLEKMDEVMIGLTKILK